MKIIINAAVAVLLIGSAGMASAAAATRHHPYHAGAYNAFSAMAPQQAQTEDDRGIAFDNGNEPHQTATGGPVGGIN